MSDSFTRTAGVRVSSAVIRGLSSRSGSAAKGSTTGACGGVLESALVARRKLPNVSREPSLTASSAVRHSNFDREAPA